MLQRIAWIVLLLPFLILHTGCAQGSAETPRDKLAQRNIPYSEEDFLRSAEKGDVISVELFLAAGMDPNAKDQYGGTALRYAASRGHVAIVQALLDKGADVNVKDNDGFTPLRYATRNGYAPIVKALLDKGADANAKDPGGWTPLAVATGHPEIVQLLRAAGAKE